MSLRSMLRNRRTSHLHSRSHSICKRRRRSTSTSADSVRISRNAAERHVTASSAGQQSRRVSAGSRGHPVTIMNFDSKHRLVLDEKKLAEVLLKPEYKNSDVAILAVAGALRKGKSFLLDYILRYLEAEGVSNWMGNEDDPLTGFSWRGGAERDTSGILLWSRPFIIQPPPDGTHKQDQIALFLMDTQGTFDSTHTIRDCTVLFSLTTMTSSLLIYNLMHNIQQDDLLHLQFFTQYAKMVRTESHDHRPPFQDIIFLVRDWSYPYEKPYGFEGGDMLMKSRLKSQQDHPEIKELRNDLNRTFQRIRCFLMPHPGLKVSTKGNYDGRLADMEPDFRTYLKTFIENILTPSSVARKMTTNTPMKCFELFRYFQVYAEACQSEELPQPLTLYAATAEANHLSTTAAAKRSYVECMENVTGVGVPSVPWQLLRQGHLRCVNRALALFDTRQKMGSRATTARYRNELLQHLHDERFAHEERNRAKKFLGVFRTPAVVLVVTLIFYVVTGLCRTIRLHVIAKITIVCGHLVLITLGLWILSWRTGYLKRIRFHIDNLVDYSLSTFLNI